MRIPEYSTLLFKTLLLAILWAGGARVEGALRDEVLMYWSMDTLENNLIPDVAGTNHLKTHNITSSHLVPGKFGKAISFDGNSQFLSLEKAVSRALPVYARQEFTVAMWVRGAPNQENRIVFAEGARNDKYPLFLLGTHREGKSGQLNVMVRETGVILNNIPTEGIAFKNDWTHIAWVNLGNSAKVYINGEQNTEYRYDRPILSLDYLSIGALYRDPPMYFFRGEIDEVVIWERMLKPKELKELMTNSLASQFGSPAGE